MRDGAYKRRTYPVDYIGWDRVEYGPEVDAALEAVLEAQAALRDTKPQGLTGSTRQAITVDLVEPHADPVGLTGNDIVIAEKIFSDKWFTRNEYLFFPNTVRKDFLDATSRIYDMSINPPMIIDERDLYPVRSRRRL
jgi:hypothetical protein